MKLAIMTAVALMAAAAPLSAQSVFDGTWKADTSKDEFGGKPYSRMLKDGAYECRSCTVPYKVAADGALHPVAGQPYFDEAAVRIVDPRTVEMRWQRRGKPTETLTEKVSADGRTLTYSGTDLGTPNGTPVKFEGDMVRVGTVPAGAHAISGEWRAQKGAKISDSGLAITFRMAGDALDVSVPTGERYTATPGGSPVTVEGDPAGTMMKVERAGDRALRFTSSRGGESVGSGLFTVAADGRTATYDYSNLKTGTTAKFVLNKQ